MPQESANTLLRVANEATRARVSFFFLVGANLWFAQTPIYILRRMSSPALPSRYACNQTGCAKTFKRYTDLKRHFKKHFPCQRRFKCYEEGCDRNGENGFYRRDKLLAHQRTKHDLQV